MNPHKWKKYSLDDADISDRTNTSAAFAFLAEIEKRKDAEADKNAMDIDDNSSDKIVFKKQNSLKEHRKPSFSHSVPLRKEIERRDKDETTGEKAILKGSKVVMPEYVIGQKVQKQNKRKINVESTDNVKKSGGKNCPTLQHLFDEEDEEED